jgi:formylglycine-generating enzyme required for sulfatase activity
MLSAATIRGVVAGAVEADDAAEMVIVPAGEFWMGADDRDDDEKPRRRVYLDRYAIDRTR